MPKFEKIIIVLLIVTLICIITFIFYALNFISNSEKSSEMSEKINVEKSKEVGKMKVTVDAYTGEYSVYQNNEHVKDYFYYDDAIEYAKKIENASIKRKGGSYWIWDNTPQFNVYFNESNEFEVFTEFGDAVRFAKENNYNDVYYRNNNSFIWDSYRKIKDDYKIENIKPISQYPELYRGCEVTSLTMLLQYKGIEVDKMTLAAEIEKEPIKYSVDDGRVFYGNPNNGFVGEIYSSNEIGYGAYHGVIYRLAKKYLGNNAVDLTECDFDEIKYFINKNIPVLIITNSKYRELPDEKFENWKTQEGNVRITYNEHSVLVNGYDENYVYYMDPMKDGREQKSPKEDFIKAWIQMGRQAVTFCK